MFSASCARKEPRIYLFFHRFLLFILKWFHACFSHSGLHVEPVVEVSEPEEVSELVGDVERRQLLLP